MDEFEQYFYMYYFNDLNPYLSINIFGKRTSVLILFRAMTFAQLFWKKLCGVTKVV